MPINTAALEYPFDPTGKLASNKITGEQHVLTPINFRSYQFIVPRWAPFFQVDFKIQFREGESGNQRELIFGKDWYFTHDFISASRACASPINGSFSILDTSLAGVITIEYQTLGGIWTQDEAKIIEIMADQIHNPRRTSWEMVVDLPVVFPVIDHEWNLDDMVGMSEVVEALYRIDDAIRTKGGGDINAHIADMDNPHQTNKTHVGLSNVRNLPTALTADAVAGTSDNFYMTPLSTKAALDAALAPLRAHVAITTGNPHGTHAHDVDAYTRSEVDSALALKLSAGQAASDTTRFDGKNAVEYREWVQETSSASNSQKFEGKTYDEAKADILMGTAADTSAVFGRNETEFSLWVDSKIAGGGAYATQYRHEFFSEGAGAKSWTKLGEVSYSSDAGLRALIADTHWIVAGGEKQDQTEGPVLLVTISPHGPTGTPILSKITSMNGVIPGYRFGYVNNTTDGVLEIWVETENNRRALGVTEILQDDGSSIEIVPTAIAVAPAGIAYFTGVIDRPAMASEVETMLQAMTTKFTQLAQAVSQ